MALRTETVMTFENIDGEEVTLRSVDENDETCEGVAVLEFGGCELVLSAGDIEDLREALITIGEW